jgi:hypothetical protein
MPTAFRLGALVLLTCLSSAAGPPMPAGTTSARLPAAAETAVESIVARDLQAHLRFLAHDGLQGRGLGHAGNDLAALYLASVLERLDLASAAGHSFEQEFDLYRASLGAGNGLSVHRFVDGAEVAARESPGDQFHPHALSASRSVTGSVVFAGYGISAPELKYDDYAGLDVDGRLVMVLDHEPQEHDEHSRFSGKVLTRHAMAPGKIEAARARGAAGLLIVPDAAQHERRRRSLNLHAAWPEHPSVRTDRYSLAETVEEAGLPVALISPDLANDLLSTSGEAEPPTVESLGRAIDRALQEAGPRPVQAPASFALAGSRLGLEVELERERVVARNVIAWLEGSDPVHRDELVVIGAHFDHDGVDAADRIYRGADDNASGTAAVLEIAEAFSKAFAEGVRPRRSVVFALWNAEEKGLLGSRHYVRHPVPDGRRPVAKINLDMISRHEEVPEQPDSRFPGLPPMVAADNVNVVHLLGYSYSPELAALVAEENAVIGLTVRREYDTHEVNLIRRSDHWPFLQGAVPAIFFTTGLHPDYHTPEDTFGKIDFEKMERIARLAFRVAWRVADAKAGPRFISPAGPMTDE